VSAAWSPADDGVRDMPAWQRAGIGLLVLLLGAALFWAVRGLIAKDAPKKPGVQQIAILKQPPPPPPKPPEKQPEPPKVKEEVKIDTPRDQPKLDEPKQANEPPAAADKPLGVDADGSAGGDGFGLAANRGGRDITTIGPTGNGGQLRSRGAYFSGLVQRHFHEALSRSRKVARDEFNVVVKVWLNDDGRVSRADLVTGTGRSEVDELIVATLLEMAPLREVPPPEMRPMQLRLSRS
jgi:periplasmic protein TonB